MSGRNARVAKTAVSRLSAIARRHSSRDISRKWRDVPGASGGRALTLGGVVKDLNKGLDDVEMKLAWARDEGTGAAFVVFANTKADDLAKDACKLADREALVTALRAVVTCLIDTECVRGAAGGRGRRGWGGGGRHVEAVRGRCSGELQVRGGGGARTCATPPVQRAHTHRPLPLPPPLPEARCRRATCTASTSTASLRARRSS